MTDNDIIKALNCCKNANCFGCPFDGEMDCVHKSAQVILDLINRQKEEIEKVKPIHNSFERELECAKQEGIKEFAERLKAEGFHHKNFGDLVQFEDIDSLAKEMTEERNGRIQ